MGQLLCVYESNIGHMAQRVCVIRKWPEWHLAWTNNPAQCENEIGFTIVEGHLFGMSPFNNNHWSNNINEERTRRGDNTDSTTGQTCCVMHIAVAIWALALVPGAQIHISFGLCGRTALSVGS